MSRETENLLKKFREYISDKDLSDAELHEAINAFFDLENEERDESLDYLEMAYQAESEDLALEYAMKALEADKDSLDAEILLIQLSSDGPEELKIEYEALIKKTEECFKEEGMLDKENIGSFWGILETRPGGLDYAGVARHAAAVKAVCPHPVCIGFGISTADDARALAPLADGLVVGSALVRIVEQNPTAPDLPDRVAAKLRELRQGMDGAVPNVLAWSAGTQ